MCCASPSLRQGHRRADDGDPERIVAGLHKLDAMTRNGLAVLTVLSVSGCGSSPNGSDRRSEDARARPLAEASMTCQAPSGELEAGATMTGVVGAFVLTLVEVVQDADGRSVQGSLTLHEQEASLRVLGGSSSAPLYGTAVVDVEGVGAHRIGDLSSDDPAAPGVLVIESVGPDGTANILLRLGSQANRRDVTPFDGGYAVLEVRELSDDGFAGTWRSAAQGPVSRGYFCARRVR